MRKIIPLLVFLIMAVATQPLCAQQVVLICYDNPGGAPRCVPVDSTHPLPVISQ